MMRIFLSIILLFCINSLHSQIIEGNIYSRNTKEPVSKANVYLDGTSIKTTTDTKGHFSLNVGKTINTSLIISHISYEPISISDPFNLSGKAFYLDDKVDMLSEIVIIGEMKFTREQMLKAFRQQFLGDTKAGKQCKILNEDDIKLHYIDNTLKAVSNKPIIIQNDFLGYNMEFTLMDFYVDYNSKTLKKDYVKISYFAGTSLYTSILESEKLKKRRDFVYKTSTACFFKHFASRSLNLGEFRIFSKSYQINPDFYFNFSDTLSGVKLIEIKPDTNIERAMLGIKDKVYAKIAVLYKKSIRSDIVFITNKVFVDEFGNTSPQNKILFGGNMADQRIGYMLPLDYELKE